MTTENQKPTSCLDAEVAALLETEPELLPLMAELLADLDALGGSPEILTNLLEKHARPRPEWRVLDAGCGKGALSLAVARKFSCRVWGIDGFAPFIEAARRQARTLGLRSSCRYETGDLRTALRTGRPYDLLIYAALGDLLGTPSETVARLRGAVKPGGLIFIDDAFLKPGAAIPAGYEYALPQSEMRRALTLHGERIIAEAVRTDASLVAVNQSNTERIKLRAKSLMLRHPEMAASLSAYVHRQERECANLESELHDAAWLLERGP